MKRLLSFVAAVLLLTSASSALAATCEERIGVMFTPAQRVALCRTFGSAINSSLIPAADNTYDLGSSSFGWRSVYADTSVLTPLVIPPGDLVVRPDADAQRLHTVGASSDAALTYTFGDAGVTATQTLTISASTLDADDDATLILNGGGGDAAPGNTRGAFISLPGEEVSGGSDVRIASGSGDGIFLAPENTVEVTVLNDELEFSGSPLLDVIGTGGLTIKVDNDSTRLFAFDSSSATALFQTFGDAGTTAVQQLTVRAATSDADDDRSLFLTPAGAVGTTRGFALSMHANEVASVGGSGILTTGDTAGADIQLNATDDVIIGTNAAAASVSIDTATSNISLANSGGTLALQEATAGSKCMGTATANGVTAVTVATTCALTASRIFISRTSAVAAGVTEPGCWATNIVNATSFDLDCNDAAEDSTFNWIIFQEAA